MSWPLSLTVECWIVFRTPENPPRFLKKGFGHVEVLKKDEFQYYIINPGWNMLDVEFLPERAESRYEKKLAKLFTVVHYKYHRSSQNFFGTGLTVLTCVEMVKYMCGIKSFFVRTPYQLYKYLIKHGGTVVK